MVRRNCGRIIIDYIKLVIEKNLNIWNEVVEKANSDIEGNRKEFWAFVRKRTKGRKGGISLLRSDAGVSLSSTKGKLNRVIMSVWVQVV